MKKTLLTAATALTLLAGAAQAQTITNYDISNARASGYGGWSNTFSGTITPVGVELVNYTFGSGTLNDGIKPNDEQNNQLFYLEDNSVITLHLDGNYNLDSLDIFGGIVSRNSIPGTLTGATISFGGASASITSTPYSPGCDSGYCDDKFSFAGTVLAGLYGNTVAISNIQGLDRYYSIAEIELKGSQVSAVPETESYALMLAGLGLVGAVARRRKVKHA